MFFIAENISLSCDADILNSANVFPRLRAGSELNPLSSAAEKSNVTSFFTKLSVSSFGITIHGRTFDTSDLCFETKLRSESPVSFKSALGSYVSERWRRLCAYETSKFFSHLRAALSSSDANFSLAMLTFESSVSENSSPDAILHAGNNSERAKSLSAFPSAPCFSIYSTKPQSLSFTPSQSPRYSVHLSATSRLCAAPEIKSESPSNASIPFSNLKSSSFAPRSVQSSVSENSPFAKSSASCARQTVIFLARTGSAGITETSLKNPESALFLESHVILSSSSPASDASSARRAPKPKLSSDSPSSCFISALYSYNSEYISSSGFSLNCAVFSGLTYWRSISSSFFL